jgi:hypothetical protein
MRYLFLLVIGLSLASCGGNSDNAAEDDSTATTESESKSEGSSTSKTSSKVTLTPFTKSQEFSDASIELVSFKDGEWNFKVEGSNYKLGVQSNDVAAKGCANSSKGQHIHLIVGEEPYDAKYVSSFHRDISDGKRSVLAFLSRSYHESIKTETAYTANVIKVLDGVVHGMSPITDPMVFYSRPKGIYNGADTKRVMLDYYLINAKPGQYVQADINGEVFDLHEWQPYYIEGLPAGDNTIKLSFLEKDGSLVVTNNNPVSRTFKLNPDPQ